jgi:hypothetical protein
MSKIEYKIREGSRVKNNAGVIVTVLKDIEKKHGEILPEFVVEESKPKDAPLHNEFEWDDRRCGEKWRLEQARRIIQAVVFENEDGPNQRAWINVSVNKDCKGSFFARAHVMSDKEKYDLALRDAVNYLLEARDAYRGLTELEPVWRELERIAKSHE